MFTVIGHCPKCGAPIYAPTSWSGTTPPSTYYSCTCRGSSTVFVTSTNSSG